MVFPSQFVLNNDKVASKTELIDLIAGHEERRRTVASEISQKSGGYGTLQRI
jgi:hypothetical protein